MRSLIGGLRSLSNLAGPRTPVKFASDRISLLSPWQSNRSNDLGAMGAVGTIFSIVTQVAGSVSQFEWKLWTKAASGKPEDRKPVTAHPALDLLYNPNPFQGWQEFCECFSQHVELTGEGYWLIGRDGKGRSRLPLTMWTVRPDRISPVPDPVTFLAGWTYKGPDGEEVPLKLDELIQLRMPNPQDPYRGMGPVQAVLADIDSLKFSTQWNRNFFLNSAEPGGVIEVDKRLSDDEFDEMTMRWQEQHRGINAAHQVAIIEQGKWIDRKFTQKDMQFAELNQVTREVLREAWAANKHILGGTDDVNRANADAAEVTFGRRILKSRLMRIRGNLNGPFLRLFGEDQARKLEFDTDWDQVVPEDKEEKNAELAVKANAFQIFIQSGADWKDTLDKLDLPSIKQGPKPEAPAEGGTVPMPRIPHPGIPGDGDAEPATNRAPVRFWNRSAVAEKRKDWDNALTALLGVWSAVLEGQRAELEAQIRTAVDRGDLHGLAALTITSSDGADELATAMDDLSVLAARRVVSEAAAQGVSIQPVAPAAEDLRAIAGTVTALMSSSLANTAGREALRVTSAELTGQEVADSVGTYLDTLSDAFLRDQLGGALWAAETAARFATFEAAPPAQSYVAEEVLDGRECDPCKSMDATKFTNLTDAQREYPYAGYRNCKGGNRCRGEVHAIW